MITTLEDYLIKRFNYNPKIDLENDFKAKESMSDFDFSVKYYTNKNFSETIIKNLDYKFLIPSILDENELISPLQYIYYYGLDIRNLDKDQRRVNKSFNDFVENMFLNLKDEEIKELNKFPNIGLNIIEIYYFSIYGNFASISSEFNYSYMSGDYGYDEVSQIKLKDPFYSYPELDFMKKIKKDFNISSNAILNVFNEQAYDYATYSYGEYNSDGRDTFMMYYDYFLKPEIVTEKKDLEIKEKIDKLQMYLYVLTEIIEELEVLSYTKVPKKNERRLNQMITKIKIKRDDLLPYKYRTKEAIEVELSRQLSI